MHVNVEYRIASESSVILYFGHTIDARVSDKVYQAYAALKRSAHPAFLEIVPSYASLMVGFNSVRYDFQTTCRLIQSLLEDASNIDAREQKVVTIPVYYAQEVGWDLEALALEKRMSIETIVALHTQTTYRVYAIGFAPGFAYLGQTDERLETARLANPRKAVPKGSVAIADRQSAVYPAKSPGGWKILGRTPIAMFDASYPGLSFVHVGDSVRFEAISQERFLALGGEL